MHAQRKFSAAQYLGNFRKTSVSLLHTIKFITGHPLNRGQKIPSLIRFAKWQIATRLIAGVVVHNWIGGAKFFVKNGETGLTGNIYVGLHEFSDMAFLLHFLRSDDLFIDVGANAGSYTLLACAVAKARGLAFEPIPTTYKRLLENVRLNHLESIVTCLNMGVGADTGRALFIADEDTTNRVSLKEGSNPSQLSVELTTLDSELSSMEPSIIKIDVEGYETPVLEGAQRTLKNPALNAIIMELNGSGNRYGFDETKLVELMFENGFRSYLYNPLARSLSDLNGAKSDSGNTLFIRNRSYVESRLKTAPRISIHGHSF